MAMKTLDWMYHRKNCNTCKKTDDYLEANKIGVATIVDCKAQPMAFAEAKELLNGVSKLYATKGTKLVELDVSEADDDELASLIIGPSGKLRAPTIKSGDVMVVGFQEEAYKKAFSDR
jgi:arsenate reductase-like glutaredoxin family protein